MCYLEIVVFWIYNFDSTIQADVTMIMLNQTLQNIEASLQRNCLNLRFIHFHRGNVTGENIIRKFQAPALS